MNRETFDALRTGTDTRPWLVIGGPCDGKKIAVIENAHLLKWWMIPVIRNGVEFILHQIDHDGHVLEFSQ